MNELRLHVERTVILAVIFLLSGNGAAAQGLGPADVVTSFKHDKISDLR